MALIFIHPNFQGTQCKTRGFHCANRQTHRLLWDKWISPQTHTNLARIL